MSVAASCWRDTKPIAASAGTMIAAVLRMLALRPAPVRLGTNRQEAEERHHEIEQDVDDEQRQPAAVGARQEVADLLGDVAVPDQQVLADPDVRPEDREREQQLAEVVQLRLADGR